jgi:hypothetical protein
MSIKAVYDTKDQVPEQYLDLFEERGGKWHLQRIEGLVTEADLSRVQRSLTQEKDDHKTTKQTLEGYKALGELEEVQQKLDKMPELEAAAKGKLDDAKIEEIVQGRIRSQLAPVERERDQLKTKLTETEQQGQTFQEKDRSRKIQDAIREAAVAAKVRDTAIDDVLTIGERVFEITDDGKVVTRDGVGITPGIAPDVYLQEMQSKRPHWWPESEGSGANGNRGKGGTGNNPFTREHWNMTEQGRILREQGREKADQLAKSAGTVVGGGMPPEKK